VNRAASGYSDWATDWTTENVGSIPRKWKLFLGVFAKLQNVTIGYVMSVCPSAVCPPVWNNSAATGQIFVKFDIWLFFENMSRNVKFHSDLTRITGTLHEDQYTFLIISRSVPLE
jgi:hypothetical protein